MKTKLFLSLAVFLLGGLNILASDAVKGNGKVVTRQLPVSAYNGIAIAGPFEMEYEQTEGAPYLEVTVDENLLPYLDIRVDGRVLQVGPKQQDKKWWGGGDTYQLRPTVLKVRSGSQELNKLACAGSLVWRAVSPLETGSLKVAVAGNGVVTFEKRVSAQKTDASVAGSGNLRFADIQTEKVKGSVAGSGKLSLKGEATRAAFSVAGSGRVEAMDCKVDAAECSAVGSGVIRIDATQSLDASVMGSGQVYYRQNPSVNKSVMGSGLVRKE